MDWIKKHKLLTGVIIIVALLIIAAAAGDPKESTTKQQNNERSQPQTQTQEKDKFDAVGFYDKVQTGQTKSKVIDLAGKNPTSCSETESSGFGKYEFCSWNGSFGDSTFVSVNFKDDLVESKSKTGF